MARLYSSGNKRVATYTYMFMLLKKNLATTTETYGSFTPWPPHLQLASYVTACNQLCSEGGLILSGGPPHRRCAAAEGLCEVHLQKKFCNHFQSSAGALLATLCFALHFHCFLLHGLSFAMTYTLTAIIIAIYTFTLPM